MVYNIGGKSFLTVGGGLSIDRAVRKLGISWWAEEELSDSDMETIEKSLLEVDYEVDYVLTHTPPKRIMRDIVGRGGTLYEDKTANYLDVLRNKLKFKAWFFGHMHVNYWDPPFYGLYDKKFIKIDPQNGEFEMFDHFDKNWKRNDDFWYSR